LAKGKKKQNENLKRAEVDTEVREKTQPRVMKRLSILGPEQSMEVARNHVQFVGLGFEVESGEVDEGDGKAFL
jgi:hypothetical protein